MDLSIVILSYNSKQHLQALLPSVWASEGVGFVAGGRDRPYSAEIIIVDNGSTDGTLAFLQATNYKLQAIQNTNTGFAAGNNLGIKKSSGRYILLLNPDTKLQPDTLSTMIKFMDEHANIGISGCKIIKPDGKLDKACRRRFPNPWNSFSRLFLLNSKNYNYDDISPDVEMEVDSVVGAFMMIRNIRKSENQINRTSPTSDSPIFPTSDGNYLDEDFFMYGEDLDLCWRAKQAGWKVWYYPKTFITHYKGESSRKVPFQALKWFHQAMWIFYKKHYAQKYPAVFNWLVWIGIKLRLWALLVKNYFKAEKIVSK